MTSKTMEMRGGSDAKKSDGGYTQAESVTDAQSRGELDADPSQLSNAFGAQHLYDWSEVAYLFERGEIPDELAAITDPIEYNYLLVRLRKEFNDKHKSNYLKYMNLQLPYHSRRDEVGGAITDADWANFVDRLEGIIQRVKNKRRRIIKRRKKRGKKKFPRKTLFKPEKKINVGKDPLWREIFIDKNDSSESDEDSTEEDMIKIFKEACEKRGIPFNKDKLLSDRKDRQIQSGKVEVVNREKDETFTLPPIKYPSMHPKEKPFGTPLEQLQYEKLMKKRARAEQNHRQKTAAGNLEAVYSEYPEIKEMINL